LEPQNIFALEVTLIRGCMAESSKSVSDIEMHPDAWQRFERAAGVVAKTPPQHRAAKKKNTATMKRRALKPKKKPGG
jgi:hypothetical protein